MALGPLRPSQKKRAEREKEQVPARKLARSSARLRGKAVRQSVGRQMAAKKQAESGLAVGGCGGYIIRAGS